MPTNNPQASVTANIYQVANPLGSSIAYAGANDPPKDAIDNSVEWLLCDGRALDCAKYGDLFALVGYSFGDGSTNNPNKIANGFNIPDLRGRFVRGTDDMGGKAAGNDPDIAARTTMMPGGNTGQSTNKTGSLQPDDFASHTHSYTPIRITFWCGESPYMDVFQPTDAPNQVAVDAVQVSSTGGNETRPKNAYLSYIIRVK